MIRRKPHRDPVTPEVRALVMARDKQCFASRIYDDHQCRDAWGTPHSPYDVNRCSLEHVKRDSRMGLRAPSDPAHLVLLCGSANIAVPSKDVRNEMRGYLRSIYPDQWR